MASPLRDPNQSHVRPLVDYIKKNSSKGYSRDSLKWALIKQGRPKHEVDKAFALADAEIASEQPQPIALPEPQIEPIVNVEPEPKPFWKRLFG